MSLPPLQLILDAYTSTGYLKRIGGKYTLTAEARRWLLPSSPQYLGNLIGYFESLYSRWGNLEYAVDHGSPVRPYYEAFGEQDWKLYVGGMRDLARILIPEVFRVLKLPGSPQRLLDIGGSHGVYAVECCLRYPRLQATIMDFAPALLHATPFIREAGLVQRVTLVAGDILATDFPGDQDCVLLFNVIHGFNEENNRILLQRSLKALRPGGALFILDQFASLKPQSGLGRFIPLMVGLNLVNEIGGRIYSYEEVRSWCSEASSVKYRRLRVPGVALIEVRT